VQDPEGEFVTSGELTLDAGSDRDTRPIGADGQVRFENIPPAVFAQGVTLHARVAGFAAAAATLTELPAGGVYYLKLTPVATTLRGTVIDAQTRAPIPGVVLTFQSGVATDTTDEQGAFSVALPQPPGERVPVRALKNGRVGFNDMVTIPEQGDLPLLFEAGT
jgi:hypothetical protein